MAAPRQPSLFAALSPETREEASREYPVSTCLDTLRTSGDIWDMRFWRRLKDSEEVLKWLDDIEKDDSKPYPFLFGYNKNCGHAVFCIKTMLVHHGVAKDMIAEAILANNRVTFLDNLECPKCRWRMDYYTKTWKSRHGPARRTLILKGRTIDFGEEDNLWRCYQCQIVWLVRDNKILRVKETSDADGGDREPRKHKTLHPVRVY